jgi:hypothetical protein
MSNEFVSVQGNQRKAGPSAFTQGFDEPRFALLTESRALNLINACMI